MKDIEDVLQDLRHGDVVIVDDDSKDILQATLILQQMGLVVRTAVSGTAGDGTVE